MKITDIQLRRLRVIEDVGTLVPAWPGAAMTFRRGGGAFVEITTDDGLTGIGPGVDPGSIEAARSLLVGENPFAIERHAERLPWFVRGRGYGGPAGYDIALWDLIGKASGQTLREILGGGDDHVVPYASLIVLSEPQERASQAASLVADGWRAIKLRIHCDTIAEDIDLISRVRDAVGPDITLMVDANQAQSGYGWQPGVQWDLQRALTTARELEGLGVFWLEEPLPRHAFADLARLNDKVNLRIAGGENNTGEHEFARMLSDGVYDVVQPESMVLGGLTPVRHVGELARSFDKLCVPHHGGGDIGVIAHLHFVAASANAPFMELLHDPPIGDYRHRFAMFADPPTVADGIMRVPSGAGLGVEIDPALIEGG